MLNKTGGKPCSRHSNTLLILLELLLLLLRLLWEGRHRFTLCIASLRKSGLGFCTTHFTIDLDCLFCPQRGNVHTLNHSRRDTNGGTRSRCCIRTFGMRGARFLARGGLFLVLLLRLVFLCALLFLHRCWLSALHWCKHCPILILS